MMVGYWDPLPALEAAGDSGLVWRGDWSDRNWRNVPGPFYCGLTDTVWHLLDVAPDNVLCDDEDRGFVFRQPSDAVAVAGIVMTAHDDCYLGFARDGDEHWTVPAVREWWSERHRVEEWIDRVLPQWGANGDLAEAAGARRYSEYLAGELADDLRHYMFWLDCRRSPAPGECLPEL
ncbi:ferredoxin [Streptomyces sp. A3M-1-3]|uniref:ferredoxin n=1 Tax=Streptomyces sp. A3M-1-3 TaxID=2962044 RepID=UPI0020B77B92|nr:ferredoxin [Streptomyces sp. A3M-1-3]MCP3820338.1 ferredoxin [Streptomyces sp. A3M-1-3]